MHSHCSNHRNLRFSISSLLIIAAVPTLSPAQESTTGPDPSRGRQHAKQTPVSDNPLAEQLRVLQAQVATLEAALKQHHANQLAAYTSQTRKLTAALVAAKQLEAQAKKQLVALGKQEAAAHDATGRKRAARDQAPHDIYKFLAATYVVTKSYFST